MNLLEECQELTWLAWYVKTCTELVMWVWLNAINKLKSYLQSGSADMCVRVT